MGLVALFFFLDLTFLILAVSLVACCFEPLNTISHRARGGGVFLTMDVIFQVGKFYPETTAITKTGGVFGKLLETQSLIATNLELMVSNNCVLSESVGLITAL